LRFVDADKKWWNHSVLYIEISAKKMRCSGIETVARSLRFSLFCFIISAIGSAAGGSEISIGINYNWWRLGAIDRALCKEHSAAPFWGGGILPQYSSDATRTTVREQLSSMRHAGFTTLRTFLIHRRPPHDRLEGPLLSSDGSVSPKNRENIFRFISDVRAAGFGTLEVSFGFSGRSAIYCKRLYFGDCFDKDRTDENWRFIQQTTLSVLAGAGNLDLRFDLQNEGCPSNYMNPTTIKQAGEYLTNIAARFENEFDARWLVSCPDSLHGERLRLMLAWFSQARLRPRFVEVHTYKTDMVAVTDTLDAANAGARSIGAKLLIGEARYHSVEQATIFHNWITQHPGNTLVNINEWPLNNPSSGCAVDTAPPYTPGLVGINPDHGR
jgi:hypothetical protein